MLGKVLIGLTLFAAVATFYLRTSSVNNSSEELFVKFIQDERRSYFSKEEYNFRLGVFQENLKKIEEMNAESNGGAVFGINKFSDWTVEEFNKLNGLTIPAPIQSGEVLDLTGMRVVGSHDWREKDKVNKIKD